jgi:hypothetical protein
MIGFHPNTLSKWRIRGPDPAFSKSAERSNIGNPTSRHGSQAAATRIPQNMSVGRDGEGLTTLWGGTARCAPRLCPRCGAHALVRSRGNDA